jgi:predicted nucleic-acid-binding Zn-ribbon protein
MKKHPPCPKCGKTPKQISKRVQPTGEGFLSIKPDAPKETIYIFYCPECGTGFTHSVKEDEPPKQS